MMKTVMIVLCLVAFVVILPAMRMSAICSRKEEQEAEDGKE